MTEHYKMNFDSCLLDDILHHRDSQVKSSLRQNFAFAYDDDYGTLLHYAAHYKNDEIVRHLISMGSDVNRFNVLNRTPLMIAVLRRCPLTVKVLLDAEANVDIANADGETAFHMVFGSEFDERIFQLFLKKVKIETISTEDYLAKLMKVGFTIYHAAYFRNINLMKSMLANGAKVNSRGSSNMTALHVAAQLNDLNLTEWLIDNKANVNALDDRGNGPLFSAANHGNKDLLELLLEDGADPNVKDRETGCTPLFRAIADRLFKDNVIECVEVLLQYGAIPSNRTKERKSIFDYALIGKGHYIAEHLIAQLVLLEKMGKPIDIKSVVQTNYRNNRAMLAEIYKICERLLGIVMFGSLLLFDLLSLSKGKMRILVRNETFRPEIEEVCREQELSQLCAYYYNTLIKRIDEACDLVGLEDIAMPFIRAIFNRNDNECYIPANKIFSYLSKRDLQHLARV